MVVVSLSTARTVRPGAIIWKTKAKTTTAANNPPVDGSVSGRATLSQRTPARSRTLLSRPRQVCVGSICAAVRLDNVARPLTLPATGGLFTAVVVFALVFQM